MKTPINVKPKSHLPETLRSLSQIPKSEEGRILWESDKLERGTFELIYSLTFDPPIEDHVKDGALWHVLNECARANNFSTKFFLQRLRTYLETHFSKHPKRMVAISQVNALRSVGLPSKILSFLGPVEIKTSLSRTDKSIIDKLELYERDKLGFQDEFLYLTCRITAVDDRSALDAAYRNIKLVLGTLNLITNGYGVSRRFGYPDAPIGTFLSAATILTIDRRVRRMGGFLSENHFPIAWKRNFSVWHRNDTKEIGKIAKNYVSRLRRMNFSDKVIQAIILFQEGLETTHIDVALLKFWTGIEVLCSREEREPTERTIERASSIFVDRTHAVMRLKFIQEFRNKIVHRGEAGEHSLLCAHWGSVFLAHLIQFCLFNNFGFRNHPEILIYLSTPVDGAKLVETISIYNKRLNTLKKRPTS